MPAVRRRSLAALAVAIFALALVPGAHAAATPSCDGAACPDLSIGALVPSFRADGSTLTVTTTISNLGKLFTDPSTVRVRAGSINGDQQPFRALRSAPDSEPISFTLVVPDSARGTRQEVVVSVDPVKLEKVERNNTQLVQVDVPPIPHPDLDVQIKRASVSKDLRTATVVARVANVGDADADATTATASAFDGRSETKRIRSLAAGASSATLSFSLAVPRSVLGTRQPVKVVVTPAKGDIDTDNDSDLYRLRIPAATRPAKPPDLSVKLLSVRFTRDDRRLVARVRISNLGSDAGRTSAIGAFGEGPSRAKAVPALAEGAAPLTLTFSLSVTDLAPGTRQPLATTVASVRGETSTANNTALKTLAIPAVPVRRRPDLAVAFLGAPTRSDGETLVVRATVRNLGPGPSAPTSVTARTDTDARRTLRIPRLATHSQPYRLAFRLPPRGKPRLATVSLKPVPGDLDPQNDLATERISSVVPRSQHRSATWRVALVIGIGAAAFAVAAALAKRRVLRRGWQNEALDRHPPKGCERRSTYTRRLECKPKPRPGKVEKLALSALDGHSNDEHEIGGKIVRSLNRALWWRRIRVARRARSLVDRAGEQLVTEIERWLEDEGSLRDVSVEARLADGKVECKYVRYHCTSDGGERVWKEVDRWKGGLKVKSWEPVTIVHVPFDPGPAEQTRLVDALLDLLARVDFGCPQKTPAAAPVPHP
jgi:CARDB